MQPAIPNHELGLDASSARISDRCSVRLTSRFNPRQLKATVVFFASNAVLREPSIKNFI